MGSWVVKTKEQMEPKIGQVYCIKCRTFTYDKGKVSYSTASNGEQYLVDKCEKCNTLKSMIEQSLRAKA
jgi:RNase P subunit RPR2